MMGKLSFPAYTSDAVEDSMPREYGVDATNLPTINSVDDDLQNVDSNMEADVRRRNKFRTMQFDEDIQHILDNLFECTVEATQAFTWANIWSFADMVKQLDNDDIRRRIRFNPNPNPMFDDNDYEDIMEILNYLLWRQNGYGRVHTAPINIPKMTNRKDFCDFICLPPKSRGRRDADGKKRECDADGKIIYDQTIALKYEKINRVGAFAPTAEPSDQFFDHCHESTDFFTWKDLFVSKLKLNLTDLWNIIEEDYVVPEKADGASQEAVELYHKKNIQLYAILADSVYTTVGSRLILENVDDGVAVWRGLMAHHETTKLPVMESIKKTLGRFTFPACINSINETSSEWTSVLRAHATTTPTIGIFERALLHVDANMDPDFRRRNKYRTLHIKLKKMDIERSGLIGVESNVLYEEYGESNASDYGVDDIILLVATGTTVHKMLLSTHELCYVDIGEHSFFVRLSSTMPLQLTADTLEWRMSENLNTSRHLNFLTQHYAFLLDNQLQVQSNARLHAEWGEIVPLAIVSFDVTSRRMRVIADNDGCVPHIGPLIVNLHVMGLKTLVDWCVMKVNTWNHAGDVMFKMMEDGMYLVPFPYARLHAAIVLFDAISTSMVANHGCVLLDPDLYASLRFTSIYALNAVDCTSSSIDCRILKILVDNARAYALFGSTTGKSIHLTGCLVNTYLGILNLHGELLCGNTGTSVLCCGRSIDGFISFHFADIDCLVLARNHGDLVSFDCYLMRNVRQNAEHFVDIIPSFGISHNQLSTNIDSNCHRILIHWSRTTSLHDIYNRRRFNARSHRSTPMCTIISFENGETLSSYHRFCHTVWTLGDASCVSCASRALNDLMLFISEHHQGLFLKGMKSSIGLPVDCYMIHCFINDTTSSIIDNDATFINSATSCGRIIHLLGTSSNVQVLILRDYFMQAIEWNNLISFLHGEWNTTTQRLDRVFLFIGDCSCASCTSGTLIILMPLMKDTRRISYWIRNDYTTSTCVLLVDCYNGLCSTKGATSLFAGNGADMVELDVVNNGEPIICSSVCALRLYDRPLCVDVHPDYLAGYETPPAVLGATNTPCHYAQYRQIYTGCLITPCVVQPHDNLGSIQPRRMYQILGAFESVVTSEHSSRGLRDKCQIHDQVVLYNYDQIDQVQVTTKLKDKTDTSHTDDSSYVSSFDTHPPCLVQAIMILCGIASHLDLQAIINRLFNWGEIWGAMFFNVLEQRIVQVGECHISGDSDMWVRYRYVT